MTLLLDTHALLWWANDDPRLGRRAREAISESTVAVSAVSAWEMEIKQALGKLTAPTELEALLREQDFDELSLTIRHAQEAGRLPRHHDDPFDRALIGQARVEGLRLVTADSRMKSYQVPLLDATR